MSDLNEAQKKAVELKEGPCMVLAGPGSGKTTVLTHRIKALIETETAKPEELLVITFTKAAAEEMKERFDLLTGGGYTGVAFGTFHSVFYRILRESGGLLNCTVITDELQKIRILEEIFRKSFRNIEADSDFLKGLVSEISYVKNSGTEPEKYESANKRVDFNSVYRMYERETAKAGKIDFDDMLLETYRLFKNRPDILSFWQKRFRYIMIDEFQDINRLQYEIVRMLALPYNNLFVVGDDDQSIYRFRGARPEIMLGFPKDYRNTNRVLLNTNYRSGKEIVEKSLLLINNNKERFKKALKADSCEKGRIIRKCFKNESEEAENIVSEIEKRILKGEKPENLAVLYRVNHGTMPVVNALMRHQIPFYIKDRGPSIFKSPVCRPVFAILNFVRGNRTRKNFLIFMNCPTRYIRRDELTQDNIDLRELKEYYKKVPERSYMVKKIEYLEFQLNMIPKLKLPYAIINYIRRGMFYDSYVTEYASEKKTEAAELLKTLDEVQESARDCETIDEWYSKIVSLSKTFEEQKKTGKAEKTGKVLLSTMHGSKGLEFNTVFLVDLNEKVIPHEKSLTIGNIEEERRLLYVGVTRAKRELFLCSVRERYGKEMEESRFLKEMGMQERSS